MNALSNTQNLVLPHLDVANACPDHREIYLRFMGHLRHVPISRMEIKVLSAIQFTADMTNSSDAHIAKELVEMGLRAPRLAFPTAFLDYTDKALMRCGWQVGAPSKALMDLRDMWFKLAPQERIDSFRHVHSIVNEEVLR